MVQRVEVNGVTQLKPGDLIYSGENLYTDQETILCEILNDYAHLLGGNVNAFLWGRGRLVLIYLYFFTDSSYFSILELYSVPKDH